MLIDRVNKVGIIGLGKMGRPIARHILAKGYSIVGWDIDPDVLNNATEDGITAAASCMELAVQSDLVIVVVGFDIEVESVLFGKEGLSAGLRRGSIVAVASTIAPTMMRELAGRTSDCDFHLIDIPLTRGEQAAEDGTLLVLGGGSLKAFEAARPVLDSFAETIHYLGPVCSGQVAKLVNNLIMWACISVNHEGLKLAGVLGMDREALRLALLDSSAQNWALEQDYESQPMPWAEKDMSIVLSEADIARVSLPLCGTVREVIKGVKIARGQGLPKKTNG